METWGPAGAIAVMLGLIELVKFAMYRRNGNQHFNDTDRAKLLEIYSAIRRDEWTNFLKAIQSELRSGQEKLMELRFHQDANVCKMNERFDAIEAKKDKGG